MTNSTRLASQIRSHRLRAEPRDRSEREVLQARRDRARTSRFRLEPVSLWPFVPAALHAYVQRRRRRRQMARWAVWVGLACLGLLMVWVIFFADHWTRQAMPSGVGSDLAQSSSAKQSFQTETKLDAAQESLRPRAEARLPVSSAGTKGSKPPTTPQDSNPIRPMPSATSPEALPRDWWW